MRFIYKLALIISIITIIGGCDENGNNGKTLLSVDFKSGEPLRYRFVSNRDVTLILEDSKGIKKQKSSEKLEMVISYELVDEDIYSNATIKATCESISSSKQSFSKRPVRQREPLEMIQGKSWLFTVNSLGQIQDYSGIDKLIKEVGASTIKTTGKRRIKSADMIGDFMATQFYMWDVIASIDKPLKGIARGDSWSSYQPIPFARVLPYERIFTYKLAKVPTKDGDIVVVNTTSSLAEQVVDEDSHVKSNLAHLVNPYEGSYQMKGMFGFLRGYKVVDLNGSGEIQFDFKNGRLISNIQNYKADIVAGFMFPLGNSVPELEVNQTIEVKEVILGNK